MPLFVSAYCYSEGIKLVFIVKNVTRCMHFKYHSHTYEKLHLYTSSAKYLVCKQL